MLSKVQWEWVQRSQEGVCFAEISVHSWTGNTSQSGTWNRLWYGINRKKRKRKLQNVHGGRGMNGLVVVPHELLADVLQQWFRENISQCCELLTHIIHKLLHREERLTITKHQHYSKQIFKQTWWCVLCSCVNLPHIELSFMYFFHL